MQDNESKMKVFADEASLPNYNPREMKEFAEAYSGYGIEKDGLEIVSIYGALGNGYWDSMASYTEITSRIEDYLKDDKRKCLVLVINSPGGAAAGMFDCCKYIKEASQQKPIYAYVTGMACSAAFAIASSCNKIFISEDAETGCCGCYAHVLETSDDAYKEMGFLHRIFRSKNAPRKNLSVITNEEEAKAYQEEIDRIGDEYLAFVATNRGVSVEEAQKTFGEGAVVNAQYALENKMVDAIGTIEDCISTLASSLTSENGGDDMQDIKEMSAEEIVAALSDEQKEALASSLCASSPSLTEEEKTEVRKAERERLEGLNALRNGSDSINALVDEAVENGKSANDIALDVVKAMQEQLKANEEDTGKKALEALFGATDEVITPSASSDEQALNNLFSEKN